MIELLKKIALYLIVILGIIYGYQFVTGESITTLPREIDDKLHQKKTETESTNPRYYIDPAENQIKE